MVKLSAARTLVGLSRCHLGNLIELQLNDSGYKELAELQVKCTRSVDNTFASLVSFSK